MHALTRRLVAELLGTAVLVAVVIGSGIIGTQLSDDVAVALLINAASTVCGLGVLIWLLGPVSGAHFNPVVTAVAVWRREMRGIDALGYLIAQVAGGLLGAALANAMFSLPLVNASAHVRDGGSLWLGEIVATAGLLLVIGALGRTGRGHLGPVIVAAWIGSAYFFTSSTSFANPAVTIGRSISDTFAGIAPSSVAMFVVMQVVGAAIGAVLTNVLFPRSADAARSGA